ncbi:phospholipase A2-like [Ornithorhynchus anatinus]|uniref:phospholipase A2-like n=1 Tax=Ornithorhynchus anatinus TaxID=9258 RepID=UPI0010A91E6D|nr:phospholipase A2-like [Ornithorhynchus anatinus]
MPGGGNGCSKKDWKVQLSLNCRKNGDGKSRPQRSLIELVEAVQCSTKVSVLEYTDYGCYCGLGGSGWPQDKTDWCCHHHDCCYGKAEVAGCSPKLDPYNFVCKDKQVECGK